MPLHNLECIKALVAANSLAYLNERRIYQFLGRFEPPWTDNEVADVLLSLSPSHFQKTVNCKVKNFPGRDFIDADQYEIHWDISAKVARSEPMGCTLSLSLKIAIDKDVDGNFAGLITFHSSGSP